MKTFQHQPVRLIVDEQARRIPDGQPVTLGVAVGRSQRQGEFLHVVRQRQMLIGQRLCQKRVRFSAQRRQFTRRVHADAAVGGQRQLTR